MSVASLYPLQIFFHQIPSPQFSNLLDTSGDGAIPLYSILSSEEILSLIHVGSFLVEGQNHNQQLHIINSHTIDSKYTF